MMNYVTLKNPMMMIPFETMHDYNDTDSFTPEEAIMLGEVVTISGKKFEHVYSNNIAEGDYLIVFISGENKMYALASEVHIMSIDGEIMEMKETKSSLILHDDESEQDDHRTSEEEYKIYIDGEYIDCVSEFPEVNVVIRDYLTGKQNREEYLEKTKMNNGDMDVEVEVKAEIIREYKLNAYLEIDAGHYEWEEK